MVHSLLIHHRWVALFLALSLLASLTTVALATNIAINTNDNALDGAWPAAPFVSDPTSDAPSPNVDIFAARVVINHAVFPSEIAFRVDVNGQFPNTDGYFIRALLDCNRDGAMTGAGDVTIYLDPVDDLINIMDGGLNLYSYPGLTDKAEVIVIVNPGWYVYEFKVPMGDGTVNWNWCTLGNIDITFETYDGGGTIMDTTTSRGFDIPNAVDVTEVKGSSSRSTVPMLALAATVLLSGLLGLVQFRSLKDR